MNKTINDNMFIISQITFTPIIYKSSEVLNMKAKSYINTYLTSGEESIEYVKYKVFLGSA